MILYILECVGFQLVFLTIYDIFLKRETFFQWNRTYLIGTYILSLSLPLIKIESFKTRVPERFYVYPEYLWGTNDALVFSAKDNSALSISWEEGLLYGGMLLAALLFGYKILQLYRLRKKGVLHYFKEFTQIVLIDSNVAFSFFKSIFLGDRIMEREHQNIIEHELVHIRQGHTYDLLFFELMRIVGWFNPLVYVYQNRISELHEFIADAQVAKSGKAEQYELLLSQVFQTKNTSFINQFFNSSLIKKRIVMLTKEKSRKIWKLKYLALMPLVFGMLLYTSCERQTQILDGGETILDYQKSTGQTKQKNTNGSRALAERQWAQLMDKAVSNDFLSKEEFFRLKLLSHKVLSESRTVIKNGDTLVYMGSKEPFKKPTEEEYEYHIRNKKAFQILDYDLSVSIGDKMDVFQVDSHYPNLKGARVVEVADVKNMEGDDFRMFNKAMTETFEQSSNFGVVLLTDGFYHFSVIPRSVP